MSLRTVLITETLRPPLAGIGRYAWELALGLAQHAEEVDLRLLSLGRWQRMDALRQRLDNSSIAHAAQTQGGARFRRHLISALGRQQAVASAYELVRSLANRRALGALPGPQPTVVHGPDYFAPVSDRPTAVTIHDLSVLLFPETQPVTRVRRFEKLIGRAVRSGFTILTDAHSVANELAQHTGVALHKVNPIHLGVSGNFRPYETAQCAAILAHYQLTPDRYVLSVGTAEPRKNLLRLLDAYERLPAGVRHQFPLVLAGGKGWNDDALLQRIERAKAAGWLRTLGYVPEAHLPALYAGARFFAYASLYEGFGLPVAEAMACGTPVLTSDCSSMPEVTAGAALLVNPLDVDAIAIGLQRGLEDEPWRHAARQRGLARAAELTWDRTVAATLAVYRKMLAT